MTYYGLMPLNQPLRPPARPSLRRPISAAASALALACFALCSAPASGQEPNASSAEEPPPAQAEKTAPPQSALTASLLYRLLVGELSFQSGDARTGVSFMFDAARRTGDEAAYERATAMALQAGAGTAALEAVEAWLRAHPDSPVALRYQLQTLLLMGRASETAEPLRAMLPLLEDEERASLINALPAIYGRMSDKQKALEIITKALSSVIDEPGAAGPAWATLGRMRLQAGDAAGALQAAQEGARQAPDSEWPARLALHLWVNAGMDEAQALARGYLEREKAAPGMGVAYAAALRELGQDIASRQFLADWAQRHPQSEESWLALGLAQAGVHQDEAARQSLRRYLELAPENEATEPERASACLALSQLAERQGDYAQAARWLDKIELDEGEAAATVLIARARLLARQGRMNEAVSLIRQAPEDGPLDARAKVLAEGNLLHSEGLPRAAFALLRSALDEAPDDPDLLYETALAAEQSGDMAETERLLRRLIQLRPESAPGYNTLGYLLADRKQKPSASLRTTPSYKTASAGSPSARGGWTKHAAFSKTLSSASPKPKSARTWARRSGRRESVSGRRPSGAKLCALTPATRRLRKRSSAWAFSPARWAKPPRHDVPFARRRAGRRLVRRPGGMRPCALRS